MRKKKNKKTVADTGYKKVDRKEKKKKEKQEEKRRQKKLSVQQSIAYKEMGRDGICRVQGKTYSKCIRFYDINYQLAQNEDKNAILCACGSFCFLRQSYRSPRTGIFSGFGSAKYF